MLRPEIEDASAHEVAGQYMEILFEGENTNIIASKSGNDGFPLKICTAFLNINQHLFFFLKILIVEML